MKIKVCGLSVEENIGALKQLPIDFFGFIFYESSKRYVGRKNNLSTLLLDKTWNSTIKKVGVFVDAEIEQVLHCVHDYHLDYVQLHGKESPEYCNELHQIWNFSSLRKAKIIKAFAIGDATDFSVVNAYQTHCQLFIFDTKGEMPGGNGVTFDWSLLKHYQGITPFLLSGGIKEDSVEAIRQLQIPQLVGVDINSKFEIEPALKDVNKIASFIHQLKL